MVINGGLLMTLDFKNIGGFKIKVYRDITTYLHDDIKYNGSEIDLDDVQQNEWDLFLNNNDTIDITKKRLKNYIMTIL